MVILSQFVLLVKLQVILSSDLCSHQPSGASGHTLTHIFNKYTYLFPTYAGTSVWSQILSSGQVGTRLLDKKTYCAALCCTVLYCAVLQLLPSISLGHHDNKDTIARELLATIDYYKYDVSV